MQAIIIKAYGNTSPFRVAIEAVLILGVTNGS